MPASNIARAQTRITRAFIIIVVRVSPDLDRNLV
jgi:hypothetical protein